MVKKNEGWLRLQKTHIKMLYMSLGQGYARVIWEK